MNRLQRGIYAFLGTTITHLSYGQIDTKDAVDEAVDQFGSLKPLLEILCGLGIIAVLIYAGWKWQSDNVDKTKLIGQVVAVLIVLGLAYWAIDQTL